ncbi:MAG: phosphonate metabolism transcriptional regulator PhnF [Pseudomonadota bacterium]
MNRPSTRTPLWRSIAETLLSEIADGHYAPGDKLPTEARLAGRFGVNRHTVRHALGHLAKEGFVHARRGAGVFVLARPLDYPISNRVRFHQNLLAAGRMPAKSILSVEVLAASKDDAYRLNLHPGVPVTICHSLSFADGTPVALSESRFPDARYPGIANALRADSSVTRALEAAGVEDYTRVSTRFTATFADPTKALHLQVSEGAPLLVTEALSQDSKGLPVEYGRTWFASGRITLTMDHR